MDKLSLPDRTKPYVMAHRGNRVLCPENTLASFQQAFKEGADILETGAAIREALADSAFLAGRNAQSPPLRMGLVEAANKSNDRLAAPGRWALTALVVYDSGVQELLASRNVQLYLPDDTRATLEQMGLGPGDRLPASGRDSVDDFRVTREPPTHILRAEVRSIARQGSAAPNAVSDARLDVYLVDYRITKFDSSEVVWAKTINVARRAGGTIAD